MSRRLTGTAVFLLGVAIPAAVAQEVTYLGVYHDTAYDGVGVGIDRIVEESAAARAGFAAGDAVVELNGDSVDEFSALADTVKSHQPGDAALFVIDRKGEKRILVPVFTAQTNPTEPAVPRLTSLRDVLDRLEWKAGRRYRGGEWADLREVVRAALEALRSHSPRLLETLEGKERSDVLQDFERRQSLLEWYRVQGLREVRAPFVPGSFDSEAAGRRIEALAARLDDSNFGVREEASKALLAFGPHAIESLERVIDAGSPEASHRAIWILETIHEREQDFDWSKSRFRPIEVEVGAIGSEGVRLVARHGTLPEGPVEIDAVRVQDEKEVGRCRLTISADGEVTIESETDVEPGDRLLWIEEYGER